MIDYTEQHINAWLQIFTHSLSAHGSVMHHPWCLFVSCYTTKRRKRKVCCKIHQQTNWYFILDEPSHPLSGELTQPHSNFSPGLILPPRGAPRSASSTYLCRLPSRCTVLPATLAAASASQLVEHFSPGASFCLYQSLRIVSLCSCDLPSASLTSTPTRLQLWPAGVLPAYLPRTSVYEPKCFYSSREQSRCAQAASMRDSNQIRP